MERMTRKMESPECGFWMVRCCRKCPEAAARIWREQTTVDPVSGEPMDRSPHLSAQIGLERVDWREVWHRRGEPISEAEWHYQMAWLRWAERNAPEHPNVNFRKPVDLAAIPIPRWS